jgi:hypothetical protein
MWCVLVCDLGTSRVRLLRHVKGCKCRIEEEEYFYLALWPTSLSSSSENFASVRSVRHKQQNTVCCLWIFCHRSHQTKAVYCRTTIIGVYLTKLSSLSDSLPLSSLERGFRSLSITYNHNEISLEHRVFSYNTQAYKNRAATRSFVGKSGESVLVDLTQKRQKYRNI